MKKHNFSQIEKKWQSAWKKEGTYEPKMRSAKKPFYNLMMFPYPSAEGLHVGNMYAFTGSDIYGRFKRMQGYDVFEPIGLDGFGIHSENYAMKIGTHPMKQAGISEKRFYKQLEMIGDGFAWNEKLETYNPEYYRWTQWVFIQMWKRGLAYRKKQAVNWCPSCMTVLADEQVISGACERCGSVVERKELEQWSFRITRYADKLLKNLDHIDWSERVKIAQRNWIGKSEGAEIEFQISGTKLKLKVFTTRPDTLFGATYMVVSPDHEIIEMVRSQIANIREVEAYAYEAKKKSEAERVENKEKTGVELKGIRAINPVNGKEIPIFAADYVLSGYGTGAIMAVPAHDERDFEFAKKFNLPIIEVIENPEKGNSEMYAGYGVLKNSATFNGQNSETAKRDITKLARGTMTTQFRLRDWVLSRQRYWGAPIPMLYCKACAERGRGEQKEMPGWYAVPEKNLPVVLPNIKEFRPKGKGESPLASSKKFYEVPCPACKNIARRETDVSDTFLDSAWYFLRYPCANEKKKAWDSKITEKWLPVHMYIGGAEHSVLHLLYSRFITMALHDAGFVSFDEPFTRFRAHGLLIKEGAKMSKSKGNVVNPDEYIKRFGADALRTYLMFLAPFEQGGDFRDAGILGVSRFLERFWKLGQRVLSEKTKNGDPKFEKILHKTIRKVTEDIESLQYNTAVSAMMICLNEAEDKKISEKDFELFLKLLAPFAPHMTEDLWRALGNKKSIHISPWPTYDPKKVIEDSFMLVVQVNGKIRATIEMPRGTTEKEAKEAALRDESVSRHVGSAPIKKVIFVPNRLINFVI